jgi:serine phosphatase RsbU (regulator of sigma subunit)
MEDNNMDITHNPYLNRTMIRDIKDFYGRKREVARIYSRIGTAHPQSVSIVGPRRIGKSSLLNFIYQAENREKYLKDASRSHKFIFIDFQERKKISLPEFFSALFDLLSREFQGQLRISEAPSYEGLKEVVTQIQQQGLKLIMLFDEFDSITQNPNFDMEFFAFLRALANRYDVAYVMSSGRHLQELCHTKEIADSPFFNIFSNLFLPPFSREEALTLIREPSEAAGYPLESVAHIILSMAGYFPFFIQIACSSFFEYALDEPADPKDILLPEIHELFLEEASDHFEYIWNHFPEDQRQVLLQLAEGKRPPISQQYLLKEPQKQGYVLGEAEQQRLFSSLFGEYIRERASLETPLEASEDIQRMERIEQELQDAQAMQQSILPSEDPLFAGLDISSYFHPATEIGGDYYDYIPLTKTMLAVAVGDVKGHGMPAGLLASTAAGCLHATLETTQSVAEVMRAMNRRVCEVKGRTFMTLCFSILDTVNHRVTFSSAGHPFPYHYCAAEQTLLPWELEGSFPLGVRQDSDYPVCSRSLAKDDVLVYYSDGLVEGTNPALQFFGFERLEAAIVQHAHHTASDIKQAVLTEFSAHCQQHEQEDDVTLIVIKFGDAPSEEGQRFSLPLT